MEVSQKGEKKKQKKLKEIKITHSAKKKSSFKSGEKKKKRQEEENLRLQEVGGDQGVHTCKSCTTFLKTIWTI
jgi:hypothetical protein